MKSRPRLDPVAVPVLFPTKPTADPFGASLLESISAPSISRDRPSQAGAAPADVTLRRHL
jgi:hypothetical protein